MHVCVCVYSSVCTGWLPLFSSWVILHIQTLSENLIRFTTHTGLCSDCEPGMRSSVITIARPFHLWQTIHRAVPRNCALQMFCCLNYAHTPFWSGCRHHCWIPSKLVSARGLESIHSLKGLSLTSSPSFIDCHLKAFRAKTITSFNFAVHSVFHLSHSRPLSSGVKQKLNPSSMS